MLNVEKRSHSRVPYTESVEYFCWDQRKNADALEISPDGMFLRAHDILPEGSMLTLRVHLPGSARAFTVLGREVHVVFGGATRRRGMGIRFLDIAPRDRDTIVAYVAQRPRLAA